jgi:hypothetical protein
MQQLHPTVPAQLLVETCTVRYHYCRLWLLHFWAQLWYELQMGDFRTVPLLQSVSNMILFWAQEQLTNGFPASRVTS